MYTTYCVLAGMGEINASESLLLLGNLIAFQYTATNLTLVLITNIISDSIYVFVLHIDLPCTPTTIRRWFYHFIQNVVTSGSSA